MTKKYKIRKAQCHAVYAGSTVQQSHGETNDKGFLIWDIQDKGLKIHHFDVKEFLKMKSNNSSNNDKVTKKNSNTNSTESNDSYDNKLSYEEAKELKRKKNQLNNKLSKIEKQIEELEDQLVAKNSIIEQLDYTDEANAKKQLTEYESIKALLDEAMNQWEIVSEEIINMESL